jgi:hypothetical protein
MWMSESGVSLRSTATRQKAGRFWSEFVPPAGVRLPASITFASVIDTVGEASCESLSQGCACSATGRSIIGNRTTLLSMRPVFMH